jgi:hypothetical protein
MLHSDRWIVGADAQKELRMARERTIHSILTLHCRGTRPRVAEPGDDNEHDALEDPGRGGGVEGRGGDGKLQSGMEG